LVSCRFTKKSSTLSLTNGNDNLTLLTSSWPLIFMRERIRTSEDVDPFYASASENPSEAKERKGSGQFQSNI
jgi:hypothetical protein